MAYECQNFKNGQVLSAECLNRMEAGIKDACSGVKSINGISPDKNGNVNVEIPEDDGGGLTDTARILLMTVLKNGVYTSDQSANLAALEEALKPSGGGGSDEPDVPVVPDEPDVPDEPKTYTITNNLTNCNNSNVKTTIAENTAYNAVITAVSGYELLSVVVTMGGSAVTVTEGVINISSVTGNIVITAIAKAESVERTLDYITANCPSGTAAVGANVSDLGGVIVTAFYSDGSSETVTDYTLTADSETIAEGENTITASYGGKTATFTVNGINLTRLLYSDAEANSGLGNGYTDNWLTPCYLMYGMDATNLKCSLSGKRVKQIEIYVHTAGTLSIGKVDLSQFGTGWPTLIDAVTQEMTEGMNTVNVDFAIGEHETLGFQQNGDTGKFGYNWNIGTEMIMCTADGYTGTNVNKTVGSFRGAIYVE